MASKRKNVAPSISPVLFVRVDGEPMSFFLRPGPNKLRLQPLIKAGGGKLCSVQQPGSILLINPEEKNTVPESAAHWYVSTQYIHDCIEKEEQLCLEDYKLEPEIVQRHSLRLNSSKDRLSGGRVAYTPEDDAAILNYVNKRLKKIGGNRLWQEMEKQRVTSHSWQSMKSRYKDQLSKKQSEIVEMETEDDDDTEAGNPEMETNDKAAGEAGVAPPQTDSADSDLTQIDVAAVPAAPESEKLRQTDGSPQPERVEDETSHSSQAESANLQTDTRTAETPEPEQEAPETTVSPQKQDDSSPAQHKTNSPSKNVRKKQEFSPEQEQPQRRVTRRQLQLELSSSPGPYGKKLRSSTSSAEKSTPSQLSKKKAAKSPHEKDSTDQPPVKKASAESHLEQNRDDTGSKTSQTDESSPVPQKAEKKKQKRQLGILEIAAKEFESESDEDEDEAPDPQSSSETRPTLAEPLPQPSDSSAEPRPGLQENVSETRFSSDGCATGAGSSDAAPTKLVVADSAGPSKAHQFIFESESQEEDSQSVTGDGSAAPRNPRPAVERDAALCLTQVQLEEDKQRIRELMSQTNQDLVNVTKALLKTSGDFSAALDLLLNPSSAHAPIWSRCDDGLLHSDDPSIRQKLQEKYGEENVAKRIIFLEVEG